MREVYNRFSYGLYKQFYTRIFLSNENRTHTIMKVIPPLNVPIFAPVYRSQTLPDLNTFISEKVDNIDIDLPGPDFIVESSVLSP